MEEISFEEALRRLNEGEVVERCRNGCTNWEKVALTEDKQTFEQGPNKDGKWIRLKNLPQYIWNLTDSMWRIPAVDYISVPWQEALRWMYENQGKKCKVAWPDKPMKYDFYTWINGLTSFVVSPEIISADWRIPREKV